MVIKATKKSKKKIVVGYIPWCVKEKEGRTKSLGFWPNWFRTIKEDVLQDLQILTTKGYEFKILPVYANKPRPRTGE